MLQRSARLGARAPATVSGSIGSGLRPRPNGPDSCKRRPKCVAGEQYTKPFGSKRGHRGRWCTINRKTMVKRRGAAKNAHAS